MAAYVTLAQAKTHLRVIGDADNADIYLKATQASGIVADYLKSRANATWTAATVPSYVQAATLLILTHLYEHRGDEMGTDSSLWEAVTRLLIRSRDPALA